MKQTVEERFWDKVDKSGECWEWQGAMNSNGYGRPSINGKREYTHRLSWVLTNGEIPDGLHVLHKCDNPPCVNPDHLFLGTQAENNADKVSKGRQPKGEMLPQSVLSEEEIIEIRRRYSSGGIYQKDLAVIFDVSQPHICDIINRKKWQHI